MRALTSTLLVACLFLLAAASGGAATIIVGSSNGNGNCFPFGCGYQAEYQQVYDTNQFPGTVTITGLEFFNTAVNNGALAMNTGVWDISLSTTSYGASTLTSTPASNIGADNTLVFAGDLVQPWAFGDTLVITLSTPFTYNPANGNLLMDVVANASNPSGPIFFDATSDSDTARLFYYAGQYSGGVGVDAGYGLLTGFETGSVPEPASFLLIAPALLGLAALRRKFRS